MSYRQTGPEVVEYNRGSYDPHYNPNTTHTSDYRPNQPGVY